MATQSSKQNRGGSLPPAPDPAAAAAVRELTPDEDRGIRDRLVAVARTCPRKPDWVYKVACGERAPYRHFVLYLRELAAASRGLAQADGDSFFDWLRADFRRACARCRGEVRRAAASIAAELRDALRRECRIDSAADPLETEALCAMTRANLERLREAKLAQIAADLELVERIDEALAVPSAQWEEARAA